MHPGSHWRARRANKQVNRWSPKRNRPESEPASENRIGNTPVIFYTPRGNVSSPPQSSPFVPPYILFISSASPKSSPDFHTASLFWLSFVPSTTSFFSLITLSFILPPLLPSYPHKSLPLFASNLPPFANFPPSLPPAPLIHARPPPSASRQPKVPINQWAKDVINNPEDG